MLESWEPGNPEAQMITAKAPGQDGVTLEDASLGARTPQITIRICASNRADLYAKARMLTSVFNPKLDGTLLYGNDAGERIIPCRPQYIPTVKDPEGMSQQVLVQLYCADPYWRDTVETVRYLAQWVGDLQFPAAFPASGMEFGHRVSTLIVNAVNDGDVPCPLRVELSASASVANPYLLNVYTHEIIRVKRTLAAAETLVIDTAFGNESVTLTQGYNKTNAFNWIDAPDAADFMQLQPGDNYLKYGAESGTENLTMAIYFTPQYTGA